MKKFRFAVPLYDIDVTIVQVDGTNDAEEVKACCKDGGLPEENINAVLSAVKQDKQDDAETFCNFGKRHILVVFFRMNNGKIKKNRYGHEKRHVEDKILQWCGVDDMESAAYLAGFLSEQFNELYFK